MNFKLSIILSIAMGLTVGCTKSPEKAAISDLNSTFDSKALRADFDRELNKLFGKDEHPKLRKSIESYVEDTTKVTFSDPVLSGETGKVKFKAQRASSDDLGGIILMAAFGDFEKFKKMSLNELTVHMVELGNKSGEIKRNVASTDDFTIDHYEGEIEIRKNQEKWVAVDSDPDFFSKKYKASSGK